VKPLTVILFVFVLALMPPAAKGMTVRVDSNAPCCDCGGKMKCCAARDNASSESIPLAPASKSAERIFQDLQAGLAKVTVVVPIPAAADVFSHFLAAFPVADAVPLFKRDCALLI